MYPKERLICLDINCQSGKGYGESRTNDYIQVCTLYVKFWVSTCKFRPIRMVTTLIVVRWSRHDDLSGEI